MSSSTRTPEGLPSRCPLCGAATAIEFSGPSDDANCSGCGCELRKAAKTSDVVDEVLGKRALEKQVKIRPETSLIEIGADSLEFIEMVVELEEKFGVTIPEDVAERFSTVGDVVRYFYERQGRDGVGK